MTSPKSNTVVLDPEASSFDRMLIKLKETHDAKGHDYGDEDEYANIHASLELGISPWRGVALRLSDKMQRVKKFARVGTLKVKGESVLDTFLDIAVYGIIGYLMFEEELQQTQGPEDHVEAWSNSKEAAEFDSIQNGGVVEADEFGRKVRRVGTLVNGLNHVVTQTSSGYIEQYHQEDCNYPESWMCTCDKDLGYPIPVTSHTYPVEGNVTGSTRVSDEQIERMTGLKTRDGVVHASICGCEVCGS